jgi:hypothetical protein
MLKRIRNMGICEAAAAVALLDTENEGVA